MPVSKTGTSENTPSSKMELMEKFVPILLIISVGLAFVVGMLWQKVSFLEGGGVANTQQLAGDTVQQVPTASLDQIKDLFNQDVIKFGSADSDIIFVEIADPSCPFCHIAGGKNPELNAEVGPQYKLVTDGGTYTAPVVEMKRMLDSGEASFVWLYSNGHGNGELGTKAMYCADEVDRFWEAHDLLMTNAGYEILNNVVLNDVTKSGQLAEFLAPAVDRSHIQECLESGRYDGRIADEQALSRSLGVTGTPGFFINDVNFAGAYSWEDMKPTVDAI